jgi:hypothetical protein
VAWGLVGVWIATQRIRLKRIQDQLSDLEYEKNS